MSLQQTTPTQPTTDPPTAEQKFDRACVQLDEIYALAYKLDQFMAKIELFMNSPLFLAMLPPDMAAQFLAQSEQV